MKTVAILGAGRIGWVHAKSLLQLGVKIVCVYDVFDELAQKFAQNYDCQVVDSPEQAITHPDVQAVYICTPTDTHVDFIYQSAKAGKAVFCEKPVTLDMDIAEKCLCDLSGCDVPIMMGFNRRFDPTHRAVQQAVINGDIGDIHNITIISRDSGLPPLSYIEKSGGMFMDMTIHDFDMVRYILGDDDICNIFASGGIRIDNALQWYDDIDTNALHLQSEGGVLCQIINSRQAVYGYDQRLEVFGSKGMLQSENEHENNMVKYTQNTTKIQVRLEDFFLQRYEKSYYYQSESFWQSVTHKTPVATSLYDGVMAIKLAYMAQQSLQQKQVIHMQ